MATLRAILSETNSADRVVEKLSELKIDDLSWRVFQPQDDYERIMPAIPAGGYAATGGSTMTPVAMPVVADLPEDNILEDAGIPDEEADYYAESLAHGATIIVIDASSQYEQTVRKLLEDAGASHITSE